MGVSMSDVFDMLQIYFGSLYVNDFNRFGRTWQVNVQADAKFRMTVDDLKRLKVHNDQGQMVPLSAVAKVREVSGPLLIVRYNLYSAAVINANAADGTSSGQAIDLMGDVAKRNVMQTMRPEWTELAFMQLEAGNTAMYAFALAVVLVFLVLAAQYESWSLAAGGHSGGADVPAVFDCGRRRRSDGYQHLHANRLRRVGGPGLQERDFDRRIRPGSARMPVCIATRLRSMPASCACGRSS